MQYSNEDRKGAKAKPQDMGFFVRRQWREGRHGRRKNRIQLNRIALDASRMKAHPKQMRLYPARMKLESRQVKPYPWLMKFNPARMKLDLRRMKASGPSPGGVL